VKNLQSGLRHIIIMPWHSLIGEVGQLPYQGLRIQPADRIRMQIDLAGPDRLVIELIGPFRMRVIIILKRGHKFFKNCAFGKGDLSMVAVVRAYDLNLVHAQVACIAADWIRGRDVNEAIFVIPLVYGRMMNGKR
jgi:hypothetical protein